MRQLHALTILLPMLVTGCPGQGDDDDSAGVEYGVCPDEVEESLQRLQRWDDEVMCRQAQFAIAEDETGSIAISVELDLEDEEMRGYDEYDIPLDDPDGSLRLETGENLLEYDCEDDPQVDEVVARQWVAIEGNAHLRIDDYEDPENILGRLTITDVVVVEEGDSATLCTIPDQTFDGLWLGRDWG